MERKFPMLGREGLGKNERLAVKDEALGRKIRETRGRYIKPFSQKNILSYGSLRENHLLCTRLESYFFH